MPRIIYSSNLLHSSYRPHVLGDLQESVSTKLTDHQYTGSGCKQEVSEGRRLKKPSGLVMTT